MMSASISLGGIFGLAFAALVTMTVILVFGTESARKRRKDASAEPPPPSSVSLLAGMSFLSGVAAILLTTIVGILSLTMSMNELFNVSESTRKQLDVASKIVLYTGLLPSVAAVAFALAARGIITESRGTVRGRPLYRTGVLLAVLSTVVVFDAKILNPSTWAERADAVLSVADEDEPADAGGGYLGVEHGPMDGFDTVPVVRVIPGSPAERAGLQAGDRITSINGEPVTKGSTLAARIQSLKPGMKVLLVVRRGTEELSVTSELSATFASLLALVKKQSLDEERFAVLKAAGLDRRYSADELRRICSVFDFDDNRLKAIETSLPHLQDPQNAYQILGALDYSGSKKKASGWIESAIRKK
jgi:hypothetical protein